MRDEECASVFIFVSEENIPFSHLHNASFLIDEEGDRLDSEFGEEGMD